MSKASLESALRNDVLSHITEYLTDVYGTDVLPVSASELTMPMVDAEGNECYALIKVSIPRGTRNGAGGYTPYNGYAAAEDYKADQEDKAARQKAKDEQKRHEEEAKEARRAARKTIKTMKKDVREAVNLNESESSR